MYSHFSSFESQSGFYRMTEFEAIPVPDPVPVPAPVPAPVPDSVSPPVPLPVPAPVPAPAPASASFPVRASSKAGEPNTNETDWTLQKTIKN